MKHESVTYFVAVGDNVKIGTTTNLRSRLAAIRTHAPDDPKVLALAWEWDAGEAETHRQLAAHRVAREWFAASPEVLALAAELRGRMNEALRHVETKALEALSGSRGPRPRPEPPAPRAPVVEPLRTLADDVARRVIGAALPPRGLR